MELKPQGLRETFESLLSFNRTFMELKQYKECGAPRFYMF